MVKPFCLQVPNIIWKLCFISLLFFLEWFILVSVYRYANATSKSNHSWWQPTYSKKDTETTRNHSEKKSMLMKWSFRIVFGTWKDKSRILPSTCQLSKRCILCLEEKLCINKESLLNKRTDLVSKCCHKNRFHWRNLPHKAICIYMDMYGYVWMCMYIYTASCKNYGKWYIKI